MHMDSSEQQIKRNILDRMDRCTVCHRDFGSDDLKVVRRERGYWVVAVTCGDCHNRNLVAAVLDDGDTTEARNVLKEMSHTAGFEISFLQDAEEAIYREDAPTPGPQVSASDVIDMHEYLEQFDGNFKRLFRERTGTE
jgi:hypothetical protein